MRCLSRSASDFPEFRSASCSLFFSHWSSLLAGCSAAPWGSIGTLMAVFGLGAIMQGVFALVHFDPRGITHESILQSIQAARKAAVSARKER